MCDGLRYCHSAYIVVMLKLYIWYLVIVCFSRAAVSYNKVVCLGFAVPVVDSTVHPLKYTHR